MRLPGAAGGRLRLPGAVCGSMGLSAAVWGRLGPSGTFRSRLARHGLLACTRRGLGIVEMEKSESLTAFPNEEMPSEARLVKTRLITTASKTACLSVSFLSMRTIVYYSQTTALRGAREFGFHLCVKSLWLHIIN